MSTNTITSHLFDSTAASARNGDSLTKANAWRKAFDKEQNEILKNIKSVQLGKDNEARADGKKVTIDTPAAQTAQPENQRTEGKPQAAQEHSLNSPTHKALPSNGVAPDLQNTRFPVAGLFTFNEKQIAAPQGMTPYPNLKAVETLSAIAVFESHFKQKWPLKNVHIIQTEKGAYVWIRDTSLSDETVATQALIDRLKQALKTDAQDLAGLVLNGKTIL